MHSLHKIGAASLLVLALTACSADQEQIALETYFEKGETVASEMSEAAASFETLMNVQKDITAWTDAEKVEIAEIADTFDRLKAEAEAMAVPSTVSEAHPFLIEALAEMAAAVRGVADLAEDPSKITEESVAELERKATEGQRKGDRYVEAVESALSETYPEMLEE